MIIDDDVVSDVDLVRMANDDVLAEDHVSSAGAEKERIKELPQREAERAREALAEGDHELVAEKRKQSRAADDQRREYMFSKADVPGSKSCS